MPVKPLPGRLFRPLGPNTLGRKQFTAEYDSWPLADPWDIPTLQVATLGSGTLISSVITGSAGWHREKRVGVAENTPGVAQSSTADLDMTGSTRYRYIGFPSGIGSPTNAGQYVIPSDIPGATGTTWPFAVEFVTDSPRVSFRINAVQTNSPAGMVFVNNKPVWRRVPTPTPVTAGSGYEYVLNFPDARTRQIRIVGLQGSQGRWGGCGVDSGYTITKPTNTVSRRIVVIGDSYTAGHTDALMGETFAWRLAHLMGADEAYIAAIGGTGWITTVGGDAQSTFGNRTDEALAMNPHVVVFAGGRNDPSAGLQTAVEATLDACSAVSEVYVLSTASDAGQADVRTAIAAACSSRGRPYLDVRIDLLPKITDNVHPTFTGHKMLADDALARYSEVANTSKSATDTALLDDTSQVEAAISSTDSAVLSETSAPAATLAATDSATATDTASLAASAPVSDAGTLADSGTLTAATTATDSATASETVSITATLSSTDSATLTDSSSVSVGGATVSGSDSAAVSDSATLAAAVPVSDTGTLSDSSAVAATGSATDSAVLSESSSVSVNGSTVSGIDSAALTDGSALTASAAATDSATLAESSAITVTITRTDSALLVETTGISVPTAAADSATLTESSAVEIIVITVTNPSSGPGTASGPTAKAGTARAVTAARGTSPTGPYARGGTGG